MTTDKEKRVTKSQLILDAWENLKSESLGYHELEEIQRCLTKRFGRGGVESPASIARILADHGVRLRHPEVLDCDTVWREAQLLDSLGLNELDFSTLDNAQDTVGKINSLWAEIQAKTDVGGGIRLRGAVSKIRDQLRVLSRSKTASESQRMTAGEVEQWLSIWLQNPAIFEAWLELRRNSADFQQLFGMNRDQ